MIFGQEEYLTGKTKPLIIRLNKVVLSGGRKLIEPLFNIRYYNPNLSVLLFQMLQLNSGGAVLFGLSSERRIEYLLKVAKFSNREAIRPLEVVGQELRKAIP